ncbi:hypothetical protein ACFZAT_22825 [Streptomyces sp. NPDC008163]|uniref:hypothetical protein n=1 Tax=Streptomyces sp. NPDC008163 TaxID=3364818 RepID=UPI0036E91159
MARSGAGRIAVTAAAAFGLVVTAQTTAHAEPRTVDAVFGGYGEWNADPYGAAPGDSIRACDTDADGWSIEVKLDIGRDGTWDRTATTRGHTSPYCTPWKTGDIKEGTPVLVQVANVGGDATYPKGSVLLSRA